MSIYEKFCSEILGDDGRPLNFTLNYNENFNFGYDVVDAIAEKSPDKRALVWCNTENEEHTFTFDDMRRLSNKAANVFTASGIKKGDRVLVVLKRHYEYWIVTVALHKIGAILIPATHMLTVDDIVYRIEKAGISGIVCTTQDDTAKKMKEAVERTGGDIKLWTVQREFDGFSNLTEMLETASDEFERVKTCVTDPMVTYFTSGTTGYPKAVIHDFSYPLAHIVTAKYWHRAEDGGLHFTVAETGWAKASWGKIYGQWLLESAVMVYDFDNFDPRQLTTVINKYGVTTFCAPPTVYRYLVRKGVPEMPHLRYATTAGELLNPEISRIFMEKTGIELAEGYGQTETTLLTGNFKGKAPVEGSIGVASPMYNIELHNKDGSKTDIGKIGEIVIVPPENEKQPGLFTGYLGNEEQYKQVWRGGVYHTGDAAWQDEDGYFWFYGRFDDVIKTGGFRVGPFEVENVLMEHPAVLECGVIGVPDALRGQSIKAVIVLSPGYEPTKELEKDIKDFCNSKLAEYKWVRIVEFIDVMPKTISGKIRKVELRKN